MSEEVDTEKGEHVAGASAYYTRNLMKTLDADSYFKLNQQAITALDILPKLKTDGTLESCPGYGSTSRTNTTIYSVLNKCRTASGQRLLALWLQHPLKSKSKIDQRLDIVQYLVDNIELRTICHDDYLRKIHDLLRLSYKVHKEKCTISDLVKIYQSCEAATSLCKSFQHINNISNIKAPEAVNKLFSWVHTSAQELQEFSNLVENSIDIKNQDETGEYMIKPDSDEDIARVSLEMNSICSNARKILNDVAYDINLEAGKTIKLETDSEKGFALKVTKINEPAVRGNPDYEQLSLVKKDGYRFTNRALTKLSTKFVTAKEEYRSLSKSIIEDIISKAVIYDNEVLEFSVSLILVDVFVAMSVVAVQNSYTKPLILESESGKIDIERMRHPCIENQPDIENYIPNDVIFDKNGKKFYLITGPNMGGKSTFLKSVAINVIMAQCGSLVPADDAKISIVDAVFTRVGAGDKQMEGISTFMEEMMDMSFILDNATEYSLVIIDELGRGTSTFDGFGLAWSISKQLALDIKSYTLFATHYHELTELEEEASSVGNLHVKALCQADKLTMLYSVDRGVSDESYGINVAQFTKFPDHVIDNAKEKLKQFEEVSGFESKREVREFVRSCVRECLAKNN